jgi:uncharacterized protein YecT (DUF1311 family)
MGSLRLTSPSNDNWTARNDDNPPSETWGQRRYGVMPPPRRRIAGNILLGLVAMPSGVWGLWLLLGAAPAEPQPLVFQVPPPPAAALATPFGTTPGTFGEIVVAEAPRGLRIVLTSDVRPTNHPETWGALPTAVAAPVVATPLADIVQAQDTSTCRDAPNLAAQMICFDPSLREAEQRMAAAYEAVLAAGASPAALGRSQARWLVTRDEMAQSSPEDLLTAYRQREGQLRGYAVALELRASSVGVKPASATNTPVILGLVPRTPAPAAKKADGGAAT